MNDGAELLAELREKNARLLAQHSDEEILDLMDRAALAGFTFGASVITSAVSARLVVMAAKTGD